MTGNASFSPYGPISLPRWRADRVSLELIAASFGLDAERRIRRVCAPVHGLDAGGNPWPDAAGPETALAGLRRSHIGDDARGAAAGAVSDALGAAPQAGGRE